MSVYHAHSKRQRGMTTAMRRALYLGASVIFALGAPALIMYAQGYRFTIAPLRIYRTASLAVESSPRDARVFINGVDQGTTPLTISGLSSANYLLEVERQAYQTWSTSVKLGSNSLTLTPRLAPAHATVTVAHLANIHSTAVSSRGWIAILHEATDDGAVVSLADTRTTTYVQAVRMSGLESSTARVTWSDDGLYLLITSESESWIYEHRDGALDLIRRVQHPSAHSHLLTSQGELRLVFVSGGTAWSVSVVDGQTVVLASPNVTDIQKTGNRIALLRSGSRALLTVTMPNQVSIGESDIVLPSDGGEMQLLAGPSDFVLIQSQRRLLVVSLRDRLITPIEPTAVTQVQVSQDEQRAVLSTPNEAWELQFSPVEVRLLVRLSDLAGAVQLERFGVTALLTPTALRFLDPTWPEATVGSFQVVSPIVATFSPITQNSVVIVTPDQLIIYSFEP